jgi:hypothetical protein
MGGFGDLNDSLGSQSQPSKFMMESKISPEACHQLHTLSKDYENAFKKFYELLQHADHVR